MGKIQASELNSESNSLYTIATKANLTGKLPTNLQSATGNNVSTKSKITPTQLQLIKTAINTLKSNFSNNCCQANCTSHKTSSACQVQCNTTTTHCVTSNCLYKTVYSTQYGNACNCSNCSYSAHSQKL